MVHFNIISGLYVDFVRTENTNPGNFPTKAASVISCMRIGNEGSNLESLDTTHHDYIKMWDSSSSVHMLEH